MSEGIGHNKPPTMLETAKEMTAQLSGWVANNPVVTTEDEARKAKLQIDRAKLCLQDLEDHRIDKVGPLNAQVASINADHRGVRKPLEAVLEHMLGTLDGYVKEEEKKRIEAAEAAKARAREYEARAREFERLEQEQKENALLGEVGIDVAKVTEEADAAFHEYVKAERASIRAEEDTHVKIGGGLTRAISIREKEVLHIDDHVAAVKELGLLPTMEFPIKTGARAFRKLHGRLPTGVSATIDRNVR